MSQTETQLAMEYMFILKSTDSAVFYPGNSAASFKIKLYTPLTLTGSWKVALTGFHLKDVKGEIPYSLLIHSPLCKNLSIVGGDKQLAVLKHIVRPEKRDSWVFDSPVYLPVNQTFLETLEIYITDGSGKALSFQSGTSHCSLHLIQE